MIKSNETLIKLEHIESSGSIKDVDFLVNSINSSNTSIRDKAYNILCNIKKIGVVEKIIKNLKNSEIESEKILLTSICWQSSLDFSLYIELFVDIAIKGNLELTIEALSVIEDILVQNNYEKAKIKNCLITLETSIVSQKNEKYALLKELINILNKI